ncbi:MAG: methionyl-tRNA formyltransferase [Candidatus Marinimicrobia bacterium CG08_land_8_20_14_0_20_45_22]|nr:MAG: methionyl-tRNA formyltransferase [Candidatus Marinimicrobia bacterium CG08_land_8_20_14_0_20_45_22]
MKIVFMGTPEFALPSLKTLAESRHQILAVVTAMDAEKGRGLIVQETPVKTLAKELNLPVFQPPDLKSPDFIRQMKDLNADLFIVVAFRILPVDLLEIPRYGAINLHASLLPKYRGAAPINWAIINGEKETGLTIFRLQARVDTGDILFQKKTAILPEDTFGMLYEKLSCLGGESLVRVVNEIEEKRLEPIPQRHELATQAPKIFPEMGEIDWRKGALSIKNLIHGLSPTPGAYSFFGKKRIKFLSAVAKSGGNSKTHGAIVIRKKNWLGIQTGDGILFPKEVQSEGKKPLSIDEFLRGYQGKVGDIFSR